MDHGIPPAAWEGRAADCLFLNATAGKGGEKNRPLNWEGWEVGEGSGGGLAPALVTGCRCAGSVGKETLLGGNWWQLVQFADCGHKSSPGISGHLHAARGTDLQCFHVGQRGRGFNARRGRGHGPFPAQAWRAWREVDFCPAFFDNTPNHHHGKLNGRLPNRHICMRRGEIVTSMALAT